MFVMPQFGSNVKAAVVVLSMADKNQGLNAYVETMPYRLNVGLRKAPFLDPNPMPFAAGANSEQTPAWSPSGDTLAFVTGAAGATRLIHVKRLGGGSSAPLVEPLQAQHQGRPDWSPRGDWVAFDQESTSTNCDLLVYNRITKEIRRLRQSPDHEFAAVFSPNGQDLAYVQLNQATSFYQLKRVGLSGANDQTLASGGAGSALSGVNWIRWSPDGQWIHFVANDTLCRVSANGSPVSKQTRLRPGVMSFDLPIAGHRVLTSRVGSMKTLGCWNGDGYTIDSLMFWSVALEDTAKKDAQVRFYAPGSTFWTPRWSFDCTRIAYRKDDDVYVGQVSFNHAPLLLNAEDMTIPANAPFSHQLVATDPDGEAITYQGVSLPPDATLSPSGLFHWPWPIPTTTSNEFFVVFRALDPSGGVSNKVVRFLLEETPAGCPMVDARTANGWQHENSILGRSLTGEHATDVYRLRSKPEVMDGRIQLRIRENEQEYTTLDQVRLWAVDHDPGQQAFAGAGGVVLGERRPAHRITMADGRDVTHLLNGSAEMFQGEAGDTLLVEMTASAIPGRFGAKPDPNEGGDGLLEEPCCEKDGIAPGEYRLQPDPSLLAATDRRILTRTGIAVEVPDGAGGWRRVQHRYPREREDQVALDLSGQNRMRLIFIRRQRLRFVGLVVRRAEARPLELPLLTARHSRLEDVLGAVDGPGGSVTALDPGDTLNLEFAAAPLPTGKMRDYFLVSTGVYTSDPAKAHRGGSGAAVAPVRFALAQNRPNPFFSTTTIRFELPTTSQVRLEVFDLLGRRMATLANREYPAGYHAVEWDRHGAAPGVYLYRITAGAFRDQKKMTLLP